MERSSIWRERNASLLFRSDGLRRVSRGYFHVGHPRSSGSLLLRLAAPIKTREGAEGNTNQTKSSFETAAEQSGPNERGGGD